MRAYIIRRLLLMIPTLFLVTIIVFSLSRLIPSSVLDLMVSEMSTGIGILDPVAAKEAIRHALGMDVPIHIQYVHWLGAVLQGDLGESLWTGVSVTDMLMISLPVSVELVLMGLLIAVIIAFPIGMYSALRQDTGGDYTGRTIAIVAISLPNFWLATMVIVYPSIWWNWMPSIDYTPFTSNPIGNLLQFLLPATILSMLMSGVIMRMLRTMMLEVMRQDYIRTAWAKGLRERTVVLRHALKNALIPVVTLIGLYMATMIGGTVIIEQIFALPGIGRLMIHALDRRDYPIVSGINLALSFFVLMINLVTDLTYAYLDPRVQYK